MSFEYQAYMLRLWPCEEAGQKGWRASLEAPHNDERYKFASISELTAFIKAQTGETDSLVTHHIHRKENGETKIEIKILINQITGEKPHDTTDPY